MDQGCSSADDELLRRLAALERRTCELESLLAEKGAVIAVQQEQITAQQAALDHAHEQLVLLRKTLFAPRRERYMPAANQSLLFQALPLDKATLVVVGDLAKITPQLRALPELKGVEFQTVKPF